MTAKQISIPGPDGGFAGYLAIPTSGHGPGVVVIQEIFGVNQVMRDICDGLAAHGYFALAPDFFWRLEPGVQLTDKSDAEWKRAFDLMGRFDIDKGTKDIQAAIDTLRARRVRSSLPVRRIRSRPSTRMRPALMRPLRAR